MTIDEAIIKHKQKADSYHKAMPNYGEAADHRQLAEWLTELEEAKSIIRVCNRVLGYLLECEIENTSTRHEVETLLKNITEYLSGGETDEHS